MCTCVSYVLSSLQVFSPPQWLTLLVLAHPHYQPRQTTQNQTPERERNNIAQLKLCPKKCALCQLSLSWETAGTYHWQRCSSLFVFPPTVTGGSFSPPLTSCDPFLCCPTNGWEGCYTTLETIRRGGVGRERKEIKFIV